jgi:hypothetical protein
MRVLQARRNLFTSTSHTLIRLANPHAKRGMSGSSLYKTAFRYNDGIC